MTATPPTVAPPSPGRVETFGGVALLIYAIAERATVAFEPFPAWDTDPAIVNIPMTGMGPAGASANAAVIALALGLVVLGRWRAGHAPRAWVCWLAAIGAIGAAVWKNFDRGDLSKSITGAGWVAAIAAGVAAATAAQDPRSRRALIAAAVGAVVMLAAKGAVQVLVEHPMTVDHYQQTRAEVLASRGWPEGSAQARAYERRLMQPEATGWFGMANVYATVMAAGLVCSAGATVGAWRAVRTGRLASGFAGLISLAALASGAGLWMSGSKGGFAAAGLGLAVLVALGLVRARLGGRRTARFAGRVGGWMALAAVASAPAAVVARGLIGERIGELSLLFRWFYTQGAARIAADHPLLGVGPGGFQRAYMTAKPALSPEDASSSHSVILDWITSLGLPGLAWAALWVLLVWRVGCGAVKDDPAPASSDHLAEGGGAARADVLLIAAPVAAATLAGALREWSIATPEASLVRLVGAAGWIGVSAAIVVALRAGVSLVPFAAGAIALAAHQLIDLAGTWPGSAAWCMVMVGATAGSVGGPAGRRGRVALIGAGVVVAAVLVVAQPVRTALWQATLTSSAARLRPVSEFRSRIGELNATRGRPTPAGDSPDRLARDLGDALSRPVRPSWDQINAAFDEMYRWRLFVALKELSSPARLDPQGPTGRAMVGLGLRAAAAFARAGEVTEADAIAKSAADFADQIADRTRATAGDHALRAAAYTFRHELSPESGFDLVAISAWEDAHRADPHGVAAAAALARSHAARGDRSSAADWAGRALLADEQRRLDPLVQLSESERDELRAIVAAGAG